MLSQIFSIIISPNKLNRKLKELSSIHYQESQEIICLSKQNVYPGSYFSNKMILFQKSR